MGNVKILETDRLILRKLNLDDAEFILELVNEPAYLQGIGDKGVHNLEDARDYLRKGPLDSYRRFGHGLYLASLKDGSPVGTCGLLKRDHLDDPDVGFAFLADHHRQGYGFEAASAVMEHGRGVLGLKRIVGIVSPGNAGSIGLLEKLGMRFEGKVMMSETDECQLFATVDSEFEGRNG